MYSLSQVLQTHRSFPWNVNGSVEWRLTSLVPIYLNILGEVISLNITVCTVSLTLFQWRIQSLNWKGAKELSLYIYGNFHFEANRLFNNTIIPDHIHCIQSEFECPCALVKQWPLLQFQNHDQNMVSVPPTSTKAIPPKTPPLKDAVPWKRRARERTS